MSAREQAQARGAIGLCPTCQAPVITMTNMPAAACFLGCGDILLLNRGTLEPATPEQVVDLPAEVRATLLRVLRLDLSDQDRAQQRATLLLARQRFAEVRL